VLKKSNKKLFELGKALTKLQDLGRKDVTYAMLGHRLDLSSELDNIKEAILGINIQLKLIEDANKN